jgi:hypothetical protein
MRIVVFAAAAAWALAACSPSTPAASTEGAASDAAKPAASMDHAGMDDTMKSADTADDANTAETPDGYTFHTYPAKIESVHLPQSGTDVWTATASDTSLVEVGEAKDEAMPDGKTHHVVKVTPKMAGNATVKFERRASAAADAPVVETRTINFMVH